MKQNFKQREQEVAAMAKDAQAEVPDTNEPLIANANDLIKTNAEVNGESGSTQATQTDSAEATKASSTEEPQTGEAGSTQAVTTANNGVTATTENGAKADESGNHSSAEKGHHAKGKKPLVKLPEQKVVNKYVKEYAIVVLAAILQSLGVYIFIQPNNFSPGGFLGIGTFVEYLTGGKFPAGLVFFIVNVPLIIVAFFKFKKDFIIKTIVTIVLDSVILDIMPLIHCPQFYIEDPTKMGYALIIAAIAGGIMTGSSIALLLKVDGCNGGTEIIGGLIQKKFPATNISWFIFALDSSVVVLSAFFVDPTRFGGTGFVPVLIPMMLSLLKMFCGSKTTEIIIRGFSSAIKFEVVTLHGEELGKELTTKLARGVTLINVKGAYTGADKYLLICVIRKRQMATFKRILSRYPDTFAYMVSTSEVYGQGFTHQFKEGEKETVL